MPVELIASRQVVWKQRMKPFSMDLISYPGEFFNTYSTELHNRILRSVIHTKDSKKHFWDIMTDQTAMYYFEICISIRIPATDWDRHFSQTVVSKPDFIVSRPEPGRSGNVQTSVTEAIENYRPCQPARLIHLEYIHIKVFKIT